MADPRTRIVLSPLNTTVSGLQGLGGVLRPNAQSWDMLADLRRGDGTGGVLVQHKGTRLYALWTGVGSIETLPQHKIGPALAAAGL